MKKVGDAFHTIIARSKQPNITQMMAWVIQ